ncbi:MOSC domain-containing protein [Hufsiella ginkgonis]|uniref:MOSC domain-containing protein n=1 Tax=Hufsiella ginkgonis TaxID=2695274 RepID=A0A7K1XVZ6_9SPHI|nr:MOSC N-terminal beta barrel domain-containing protein [Hufsiella ginkgonis]MXV15154.1 MOSC domain-containing protein [Hufsiella ginkgonis]
MLRISDIFLYPVKSTYRLSVTESAVLPEGLAYDRRWAIIDRDHTVLTAREYPAMLGIRTRLSGHALEISTPDGAGISVTLNPPPEELVPATLFSNEVSGIRVGSLADQLISDHLGTDCRLIFMDDTRGRIIPPKYNARATDKVSYADTSPVMILSEESVAELNGKLAQPVSVHHFRPNVVVSGCLPQEEESWKLVRIGDVILEANETCKRCVFTLIDPETHQKRADKEPLKTLAAYKKHPRGGVSFGITLVPRSAGTIRRGDRIEILETAATFSG